LRSRVRDGGRVGGGRQVAGCGQFAHLVVGGVLQQAHVGADGGGRRQHHGHDRDGRDDLGAFHAVLHVPAPDDHGTDGPVTVRLAEGKGLARTGAVGDEPCESAGVRLLLVEDDPSISVPLRDGLIREGYDVEVAATGAEALAAGPSDLVLLDLGLPDLEGRVVCQQLRERSAVPIIVVTARADEIDRVTLLELGADDYVVKPFGFRELVARIRRRAPPDRVRPRRPTTPAVQTIGDLADRHADPGPSPWPGTRSRSPPRSTTCSGAWRPTRVRSAAGEQLIHDVWDENWWGSTKTLDVHIASLRKKLRPELIETVRSVGYRLVEASPPTA
jgi:two-component system response regulator RegX3